MNTFLDDKISQTNKELKRLRKERDAIRFYNRLGDDVKRQQVRLNADLEREAKRCKI
jgi:hypothetical protein